VSSHMHDVSQPGSPGAPDEAVPQPLPRLHVAPCVHPPFGGVVGHGNSRTHSWFETTYWPPTLLPSGHCRARSGTARLEQSGSPGEGPPLLELLLVGPLLEPVDPPLLEPVDPPLPEPDDPPLLAPDDDPLEGGPDDPPPAPGSTRPMQPEDDRPARTTGTNQRDRRAARSMSVISAACVPRRQSQHRARNPGSTRVSSVPK
jgi:hypothetical protein